MLLWKWSLVMSKTHDSDRPVPGLGPLAPTPPAVAPPTPAADGYVNPPVIRDRGLVLMCCNFNLQKDTSWFLPSKYPAGFSLAHLSACQPISCSGSGMWWYLPTNCHFVHWAERFISSEVRRTLCISAVKLLSSHKHPAYNLGLCPPEGHWGQGNRLCWGADSSNLCPPFI